VCIRVNGADGISDMEGKAVMGGGERVSTPWLPPIVDLTLPTSTSSRMFSACAAAFEWRSVCALPIWLLVVPAWTPAAFAMLRVPCAASSRPGTF
jgi:hypothetical protein